MSIEARSVYIGMNPDAPVPWQGLTTEEQSPYRHAADTIYRIDHEEEISTLEIRLNASEDEREELLDEVQGLRYRIEELETALEDKA